MIFKVVYKIVAGHTHCAPNMTFAKCGDFCVRNEELEDMRSAMAGVSFKDNTALPGQSQTSAVEK